jgi:hypothetical protein
VPALDETSGLEDGDPVGIAGEQQVVRDDDRGAFSGQAAEGIQQLLRRLAVVLAAAQGAGLDRVAQTLPDGLDTRVGQKGRKLSGGQRQRILRPRVPVCGRYAAPLRADCAGAVWKIAAVATARELLLGRSWAS